MPILAKRQHGQTWDNVPTIDGSRWGFIGAMIAVFVVVVLFITILICCLCRRKGSNTKMNRASKGSNLATVHPEPTYPNLRKPATPATAPQTYPAATSHNDAYGYQSNGRNDMQQYNYGNQYQGSNYEQHADEPAFEPVPAPIGGAFQQNSYQVPSASNSLNPSQMYYPNQQNTTYSQSEYPQTSSSPAPHAYPQQHMESSYPAPQAQEQQYDQAYSYSPAAHEEEMLPPAYPAGSVEHTHDLPKSRMPPPGM